MPPTGHVPGNSRWFSHPYAPLHLETPFISGHVPRPILLSRGHRSQTVGDAFHLSIGRAKDVYPRRSLLLATQWSSTLVPVPQPRNLATMVSIAICVQCTLILAGKCLFTVSSDWASFEYLCNAPTTRKRWDLLYLLYLAQDEIRHRLPGFQAH